MKPLKDKEGWRRGPSHSRKPIQEKREVVVRGIERALEGGKNAQRMERFDPEWGRPVIRVLYGGRPSPIFDGETSAAINPECDRAALWRGVIDRIRGGEFDREIEESAMELSLSRPGESSRSKRPDVRQDVQFRHPRPSPASTPTATLLRPSRAITGHVLPTDIASPGSLLRVPSTPDVRRLAYPLRRASRLDARTGDARRRFAVVRPTAAATRNRRPDRAPLTRRTDTVACRLPPATATTQALKLLINSLSNSTHPLHYHVVIMISAAWNFRSNAVRLAGNSRGRTGTAVVAARPRTGTGATVAPSRPGSSRRSPGGPAPPSGVPSGDERGRLRAAHGRGLKLC